MKKVFELDSPKSREQIAWEYGINSRTLVRRLNKLGIRLSPGAVFPKDQKLIYEVLGPPVLDLIYPVSDFDKSKNVFPQ